MHARAGVWVKKTHLKLLLSILKSIFSLVLGLASTEKLVQFVSL